MAKQNFFSDLFVQEQDLKIIKVRGQVKGYNKSIETRFNLQTGSLYVETESSYDGYEHRSNTQVTTSPTLVNSDNVPVIDFFLQVPNRGEIDVTLYQDVRMRDGHTVTLFSIVHQNKQFLTKIVNHDSNKYYMLVNDAVVRQIAEVYINFKKIGMIALPLPVLLLLTGSFVGSTVLFAATFFVVRRVIVEKNVVAISNRIASAN